MSTSPLLGVEALLFDVFGTVVDWQGSVHRQLQERVKQDEIELGSIDLLQFTKQWRAGYMRRTREIAGGAPGPTNVDQLHRELLDDLLKQEQYAPIKKAWDETALRTVNLFWHNLDGWRDSSPGLTSLGSFADRRILKGTLSNGSARLLIDVAKHAQLDWDFIFSGDLLNSYKPNPAMYLGACKKLDLEPGKVAMVAAHIQDCRAAKSFGLRTIYLPRETEDNQAIEDFEAGKEGVRGWKEGGEVDGVAKGLDGICDLLRGE
ncbi:BZ3500_MvSof-1268-A1-R1_Chr6-3g08906 [Microbotryum saponariae]|uniref:BZ3500_MvSof-1268-A1-R1_Chr6-3g08906 protein n=1 Tax=Microbotryum saponariae TaxID=289078 RepID=A0A2X0LQ15_9BASI|nr:BZ3500_MvSof-1268-A1-R1_Chr6-3g08906 [Microbotryum saponariae]SDA07508.1 BZ3501_MvSof-1269-A2-R1_Chr6-2g08610 [Microbotryum saponariae]